MSVRGRLLGVLPPFLAGALRGVRRRTSRERRSAHLIRTTYDEAARTVRRVTGDVVATGPFQGMKLVPRDGRDWPGIMHTDAPLLLGSYEAELHGQVERAIAAGYRQIVDIGAAEGYYAVGLAMRMPEVEIIAFDLNPVARDLCAEAARINGVADRVRIEGEATPELLQQLVTPRSLVISDCEGCERHLLDPELVPALRHADLLVELHDFLDPGLTELIRARFSPTHDLELVTAVYRDPGPYQHLLTDMPEWIRPWIVSEFRGGGVEPHHAQWAVMVSRDGA